MRIFLAFLLIPMALARIVQSTEPVPVEEDFLKGMHQFFDCPDDEIIYYDYIIVGAGTAGAVLANRLSGAGYKVLALEAGEFRNDDPVVSTANWLPVVNELTYNPRYSNTYPVVVGFLQSQTISEGRMIGGSSGHNYLTAGRGTPAIYNGWAAVSGDNDWLYNTMLPIMKLVERYTANPATPANLAQRGLVGPISVYQYPPVDTDPLLIALSSVSGSPFTDDNSDATLAANGISALQEFITPPPNSRRSFAGNEFLRIGTEVDANGFGLNGRKLRVITNARALRFDLDASLKATSVTYVYTKQKGSTYTAHLAPNSGKLILSAGAKNTPALLMHSGVGPAADLAAAGIGVKLNSPQVGKNVQTHYGATALMTGTLSSASVPFIDLSPYMPCPFPSAADGMRRVQLAGVQVAPDLIFLAGWPLNPTSKGSYTVVDSDPLVDLKFDYPFYSDGPVNQCGSDAYQVVSMLKILQATAVLAGEALIQPSLTDFASDDALLAYARAVQNLSITSHWTGSARMGTNIANSVVNGNLKVHGLKNVYVGDASVAPRVADFNTTLMVYYIAYNLLKSLGITPTAE